MATTKIRGSNQIFWDADIDFNNKKLTNLASPSNASDAATKQYVDNVASGTSSSLHTPVQDITTLKTLTDYQDKMLINVEDVGLYRYDTQSTVTSDNNLVVRPNNIASDASPGRWIKMSSSINEHNNLSNIQGGTTGQYYHLTSAEKDAVTRTANGSQNGLLSSSDWTTFNSKLDISKYVCRETPSGLKNGSNVNYTLANTPVSGTEMVYLNGILQELGSGNDYTISGNTITMAVAPLSTDKLLVTYWRS